MLNYEDAEWARPTKEMYLGQENQDQHGFRVTL